VEKVDIQKEQQLSHLAQSYTFTLVERVHTQLELVKVGSTAVVIRLIQVNNKVGAVALHI
jgi:hypothetical protein